MDETLPQAMPSPEVCEALLDGLASHLAAVASILTPAHHLHAGLVDVCAALEHPAASLRLLQGSQSALPSLLRPLLRLVPPPS